VAGRSYRQFCAIASALDTIGERWTLLIIRELLTGPKRYSDLLDGLPGIPTDMLAARLRRLEDEGLVEREVLPPPAASKVYVLTGSGLSLEPVIAALARWVWARYSLASGSAFPIAAVALSSMSVHRLTACFRSDSRSSLSGHLLFRRYWVLL